MGAVYFYQLSRSTPEDTLLRLLDRALAQGWKVAVRGTDRERLEDLDALLWTLPPEGFLPHGMAGAERAAEQPVLLTLDAAENAPDCIMAVHGATVGAEEALALERCCVLFDEVGTPDARQLWKRLTGDGVPAQYWSEESGKWEKMAESEGGA